MPMVDLDHVNIRTADVAGMRRFYADVLGMVDGDRPPFRFGGAWLYCGERAAVHLVEDAAVKGGDSPRIEHFAFRARDLEGFLARLRRQNVPYRISVVPGAEIRQVNIFDPDGNHIEVAFGPHEQADLSDFPGEQENSR